MSTFDGLIREFPTVAIDNFKERPGVNVYLLSHVHSDHLSGLAAKAWNTTIYCSQITAQWLPLLATRSKQIAFESGQDRVMQRKYAHLAPFLRPLAVDFPHYIDLGNGRQARLCLIPAHHCPGAVMFLLQDDRSCILYTGDARNEVLNLQGLSTMPIFSSSAQRIDRLYLDTTCCHQAFQEFPSRDLAISDLITFINRRPRLAHYYIDAWTFGYEDIWIALSKAYHTKVHVSPYLYELYEAIDDLIDPKILPHLTLDGISARFHSCRLRPTCGYGGAGGEHSSARELIRIQPNVPWFSEMVRKARGTEGTFVQSSVVGRGHLFKFNENLPPSIGKKDDLCYYINYACHASLSELRQLIRLVSPRALFPCVLHRDPTFGTLYRSNRDIIGLLVKSIPEKTFFLEVEEYEERCPCLADGITTDFQSFHHAKEFHVLDMSDTVLGINPLNSSGNRGVTALDAGNVHLTNRCTKAISTKEPSLILSPRSNHLRKKMEKLKRQLRNTASLEEDGVAEEESILEDGPLSLDLEVIERKRKWWLEHERGKSTTQEEWIGDEDTDRQSSTLQSNVNHGQSAGNAKPIAGGEHAEDGNEINDQIRHTKGWFDQSTLELNPSILGFEKEEQQYQDLSPSHSLSTNRYLSSSPDSISNCATYTGHTSGDTTNLISSASSIVNLPCSIPTASIPEPKRVATRSETATGATGLYGSSPVSRPPARASEAPIVECISIISSSCSLPAPSFGPPSFEPISTLSCIPRTPPKRSDCGIILGESPTTTRYYSVIPQPLKRSSSPSLPHSFKNTAPTIGNIFAQLAWSPPLRPTVQLSRAQTDPRHGLQREPRQHFSTTTSPKRSATTTLVGRSDDGDREVIIIESSDDEIDGLEVGQRRDMEAKKQKPSQASEQDLSSQDVACLEYQDMVLENGTLSYLM